ncbi:MAG TPA: hypothetical protein VNS32_03920 [Flavisolibacter sp.]|nr:hypothetical protein [Flavisolibacter sp.]
MNELKAIIAERLNSSFRVAKYSNWDRTPERCQTTFKIGKNSRKYHRCSAFVLRHGLRSTAGLAKRIYEKILLAIAHRLQIVIVLISKLNGVNSICTNIFVGSRAVHIDDLTGIARGGRHRNLVFSAAKTGNSHDC